MVNEPRCQTESRDHLRQYVYHLRCATDNQKTQVLARLLPLGDEPAASGVAVAGREQALRGCP